MKERTEVIYELLNKYFEGDTSLQEEQQLREYFTAKNIDGSLSKFAPIFHYFKDERNRALAANHSHFSNFTRIISMVAASIILLIGTLFYPIGTSSVLLPENGCTGTYVRIEGTCYNNQTLVFSHAAQAIVDLNIILEETTTSTLIENNSKFNEN